MAKPIKQDIKLGLTRVDLGRTEEATLFIETDKAYNGGVKSSAKVFWVHQYGRTHAFGLGTVRGDFNVTLKHQASARATQTAIERQHREVFTPEVIEQITASAKNWYGSVE